MKKITTKLTLKALAAREVAKEKALMLRAKVLEDTVGEGYVDSAVKIIIAVVIGGLLLTGLVLLFNGTIFPSVTQKVTELFTAA